MPGFNAKWPCRGQPPSRRHAYIQGARLAVWQAITVLRSYDRNVVKAAAYLRWPEAKMHAAIAYTKAFPAEIEEAIEENESVDFEQLSRLLPGSLSSIEDNPDQPSD